MVWKRDTPQITRVKPTVLFRNTKPLGQVVEVSIRNADNWTATVEVWGEIPGAERLPATTALLQAGDQVVRIAVPDLQQESALDVYVRELHGDFVVRWSGNWKPARKWKIHLIKASHYDLGYDGRVDHMQKEACCFIDLAKRLCTDRAQHHNWHYYLEHMGFIRAYEREKGELPLRLLMDQFLRTGRMTLLGNPSGPHWHWMDYEQIARSGYPARREMRDRFDLDVPLIAIIDNPSGSWSAFQAFAQSGFRYLLRFGQAFRGPGSFRTIGYPKIFYVEGPNEKDRILCDQSESYSCGFWFGQNGSYAQPEYVEKAGFDVSNFLEQVAAGAVYGDYPYDTLIVPNYVDWAIPCEDERVQSTWAHAWRYPKIHFDGAAAAMAHIESKFRDQIPVLRGDTKNFSGDYSSIDPASQGLKRRSARLLPFAEGLQAIQSAQTGEPYPWKEFNDAYVDLVEYDEHCWPTMLPGSDTNIFNTTVMKTNRARRFHEAIEARLLASMNRLAPVGANSVETRLLVWNSIVRPRTDLVRMEVEPTVWNAFAAGKAVLIDCQTGLEVKSQCAAEGKLIFVAEDVPAYGWKSFRVALRPRPERAPSGPAVRQEEDRIVIQNQFYRLELCRHTAAVTAWVDLRTGKQLLDAGAPYGFNQWLRVHTRKFGFGEHSPKFEVTPIGTSRIDKILSGPVFLEVGIITEDTQLGAEIYSRYTLYEDLNRLDVTNEIVRMEFLHTPVKDRYRENAFVSFPIGISKPAFHYELAPGVVNPAKDALPSVTDFITINRWVDVANAEGGVTFAPHEAATVHLGEIRYNQLRADYRPICSHLYSYAWSNRMAGLTTLSSQDYKATLTYSLRSHEGGWVQGKAHEFGWAAGSPLVPQWSTGNPADRPAAVSFAEIDAQNIQLTVLKRAELPGMGYILRLVEVEGRERTLAQLRINFAQIMQAFLCDLVETPLKTLPVEGQSIRLEIGRFDCITIQIQTRAPRFPEITEFNAEALDDSSAWLSWRVPDGTGINIYRSTDPHFRPTAQTLITYTEKREWMDTGLNPGQVYYYRIAPADRHNCQGGLSPAIVVRTAFVNKTPPAKLQEVGVVPMDWDRLTLYWRRSPESDIARYLVYSSDTPGISADKLTPAAVVEDDGFWYQIYSDTGLQPGEVRYYRVLPMDQAGNLQPESICVFGKTPSEKRLPEER